MLIAAIGLTSCGGDSEETTQSTAAQSAQPKPSPLAEKRREEKELEKAKLAEEGPPLPKAEFIRRANATCAQQHGEILERLTDYRRENAAELSGHRLFARSVGDVILPGLLFWHDAVRILSAPRAENDRIEASVEVWEHELEAGNDRPYSFDTGAELAALFAPFNSFARSYGLDACVVTAGTFPGG